MSTLCWCDIIAYRSAAAGSLPRCRRCVPCCGHSNPFNIIFLLLLLLLLRLRLRLCNVSIGTCSRACVRSIRPWLCHSSLLK